MAEKALSIYEQLDIPTEDWKSDPHAFAKLVKEKAEEIRGHLNHRNSLEIMRSKFQKESSGNTDAVAKADEVIESFLDTINNLEPAVVANLMPRLAELVSSAQTIVHVSSMRVTVNPFSKKRYHALYIELRKKYEQYSSAMQFLNPDMKLLPTIPPVSGNYATDSVTGVREFIFEVDGEVLINPFTAARRLGITIEFYMDLVDVVIKSDGTINGHTVKMEEL